MIEIAYRLPWTNWKRKNFKTEKAMFAFLKKLEDKEGNDAVEIRISR
jgi:hypothetical protein